MKQIQIPEQLDSSPLARGRQKFYRHGHFDGRFIPPCEGKTVPEDCFLCILQIHPPLRGEDNTITGLCLEWIDSSPLARGRPAKSRSSSSPARFIPPCEGKTLFCRLFLLTRQIHPPLRGEYIFRLNAMIYLSDSSPLARGILHAVVYALPKFRFIPPCEGNTLSIFAGFTRVKILVVQFVQRSRCRPAKLNMLEKF